MFYNKSIFLEILQAIPDTLISRKYNNDVASEVSLKAKKLLNYKDLENFDNYLNEFDDYLYENHQNPGMIVVLFCPFLI